VTVEARGPLRRFNRRAVTDRGGNYELSPLPPGTYDVSFRLSSFADLVKKAVRVAGRERLDIGLQLVVTADMVVTSKRPFMNLPDTADFGDGLVGIAAAASQGIVTGREL